MLLDQVTEAMRDFESAVRYSDSFPIALVQKLYTQYRLAFTQRDAAGIQTAMTAFVEAIEKYPSCPECYLLYAQVRHVSVFAFCWGTYERQLCCGTLATN